MVIRQRLRAIFFPLILYTVSGTAAGYFVWHANNGERGLKANDEFARKIEALESQLQALKAEHAKWQHKITLMKGEMIDRDLLDEEARQRLGRAGKNDLVVFLPLQAKESFSKNNQ
jgi:cell division protein FtsB